MLSKEVKDTLEGIHFFLTDGLKNENLSGKVECMRKGLLLQLEAMRATYPSLSFTLTESNANNLRNTSTSLPYLNVEQHNISCRMSTSSSSTNYSSTGGSNGSSTWYSGDGIITGLNHDHPLVQDKKSENEEDFEEIDTSSASITANRTSISEHKRNEDKDDDSYAEGIEPVSFRLLVGTCDHHGVLRKRSKGILPGMWHSKAFKAVLSGTLLYLYVKESDDRQKKVIDISGYQVEETAMDENKLNSRRRDAFQLVAHRRKTHVFCTTKRASMERWMNCLQQAIACAEYSQGSSPLRKNILAKVDENSRQDLTSDNEEGDEEEDDDEFYEELNPDDAPEVCGDLEKDHPNLWKPPLLPYQTSPLKQSGDDASNYYSVPDEERVSTPDSKPIYYNERKPRVPPERPPLPAFYRDLNRTRPLPEAPRQNTATESERESLTKHSDDEIYCEIDEDLQTCSTTEDDFKDNFSESMNELFTDTNSLSKEIFDTINERVPRLPARAQNGKRLTDLSLRSNTSSSTDTETYDVPNEVRNSSSNGVLPHWKNNYGGVVSPSLPPRGSTSLNSSDEESEYKVPSYTYNTENLYQSPRSIPVPVNKDSLPVNVDSQKSTFNQQSIQQPFEDLNHHSDNDPASTDVDKVRLAEEVEGNTDNIINTQSAVNNNNELTSDSLNNNKEIGDYKGSEDSNIVNSDFNCDFTPSSSSSSLPTTSSHFPPNPQSNSPNLMENVDSKSKENEIKQINSSNSVKDLIAKIKQIEESTETSQIAQPNNIRRSKISLDSSEKSLLVENKNIIEVSRTVQSIKNELENKERLQLDVKEIKDAIYKCKNERPVEVKSVKRTESDSLSQCSEQSPSKDYTGTRENSGLYIAKFAYVGRGLGELSFSRGDEVLVQSCLPDQRLWKGIIKGRQGLVPREYLRKKEDV